MHEMFADWLDCDEKDKFRLLVTQLKGSVLQWLSQHQDWGQWEYKKLIQELLKEYETQPETIICKLEQLQLSHDLTKFNLKFKELAQRCRKVCPEGMQKRIYLRAIKSLNHEQGLTAVSTNWTLNKLMGAAIVVEDGQIQDQNQCDDSYTWESKIKSTKDTDERASRRISC